MFDFTMADGFVFDCDGTLLDTLDAVPRVGEEFVIEGYSFKVRSMRRRRISGLHVRRLGESNQDASDAEE